MKSKLTPLSLSALLLAAPLTAQVIDFTAGEGDFTIFYDTTQDSWDVVFRAHSNTQATGLDTQADQTRFGASANDFVFSTLNVHLTEPEPLQAGAFTYFATPAEGQFYERDDQPDLGIRTRLRTDGDTEIFSTFTMTLNWANSIRPDGANFALFQYDELGQPVFAYETVDNNLTQEWTTFSDAHWHWGFSQLGDYTLVFDLQGEFVAGGFSDIGTVSVNFEVIPEPSTVALLLGIGTLGLVFVRRFRCELLAKSREVRQSCSDSSVEDKTFVSQRRFHSGRSNVIGIDNYLGDHEPPFRF